MSRSHSFPSMNSVLVIQGLVLFLVIAAKFSDVDAFYASIAILDGHSSHLAFRPTDGASHIHRSMSTSKSPESDEDDETTASTPSNPLHPIRAGFLGCGTIASSIATGLANPRHRPHLAQRGLSLSSISVTRRSESKSRRLQERFPEVVTVYDSAEEVAAHSDVVFLCVLPQHVDEVLEDLRNKEVWRSEEHTLVSLVVRGARFDRVPDDDGRWRLVLTRSTFDFSARSRSHASGNEQSGGFGTKNGSAPKQGIQSDLLASHCPAAGLCAPSTSCV